MDSEDKDEDDDDDEDDVEEDDDVLDKVEEGESDKWIESKFCLNSFEFSICCLRLLRDKIALLLL